MKHKPLFLLLPCTFLLMLCACTQPQYIYDEALKPSVSQATLDVEYPEMFLALFYSQPEPLRLPSAM